MIILKLFFKLSELCGLISAGKRSSIKDLSLLGRSQWLNETRSSSPGVDNVHIVIKWLGPPVNQRGSGRRLFRIASRIRLAYVSFILLCGSVCFSSNTVLLNTTVVLGVLHIRHERTMFKHAGNIFNCSSLILFIKDLPPKNKKKMKFVYFSFVHLLIISKATRKEFLKGRI